MECFRETQYKFNCYHIFLFAFEAKINIPKRENNSLKCNRKLYEYFESCNLIRFVVIYFVLN